MKEEGVATAVMAAVIVVILVVAGIGAYFLMRPGAEEKPGAGEEEGPVRIHDQSKEGRIERDEIWSGEILVTGYIEVPSGVTLTIEPGTMVKFMYSRDYKNPDKGCLQINGGVLRAIGTPEEPIWFTSDASEPIHGDWEGIFIGDSRHNNVIKYSIVEYAYIGIQFWTSSGTVANSIVRWITAEGIYMERSNPTIENNTIYGTGFNGIAMEQFNENVVIRCNRIENNQGAGIHGEATKATLENNVVANNRTGITFDDYCEVDLRHNLVENNSSEGLTFELGTKGNLVFNEIRNNLWGIRTSENSWLTAHNNDIYNNEIALEAYFMQQLDVENNWWGTVDSAIIRENIRSDQEVPYEPFLTGGVVDVPEPVFDYQDVKKTELGYIPGDPEDEYSYIYDNEDETRRVVKKIGENLMFGWSLAWDGEYLWRFTSAGGGDLIKVNPETGKIVAQFPNPGIAQDRGIAFDGQHLWINDFTALKVFEVDPANGEVISSFDIPEMGSGSSGIAWDGQYLYLVDWLRRNQPGAPLYKVDRQGNLIGTIELEEGGGASITFDGENFWVTPSGRGIHKYDMQGRLVGEIYAAAFGGEAIAHDGEYLWVLHRTQEGWNDPKLYQIEILNDTILLES